MTPEETIKSEIRSELIARIMSYDNQIEVLKKAPEAIKDLEALKAAAEAELKNYPESK